MHWAWLRASKAALLQDCSLLRAPNHRHYPDPHCCAIPALKRLCAVPVRLLWHYHTITHAFGHVWLCPHTWRLTGAGNSNVHLNQKRRHDLCVRQQVVRANSWFRGQSVRQCNRTALRHVQFTFALVLQHCSTIVCVVRWGSWLTQYLWKIHLTEREEVTSS